MDASKLRDEILADARREAEKIVAGARQEAGALVAKAKAEAEKHRQERLDAARAEAKRRTDLLLATLPVEISRRRAMRLEALLQSIHDEACRQLREREGFDYQQTLAALVEEAVSGMEGKAFVVKIASSDQFAKDDVTVETDENVSEGVIIQDADGRQIWDNRLTARLDRMWPELRRQIVAQTSLT